MWLEVLPRLQRDDCLRGKNWQKTSIMGTCITTEVDTCQSQVNMRPANPSNVHGPLKLSLTFKLACHTRDLSSSTSLWKLTRGTWDAVSKTVYPTGYTIPCRGELTTLSLTYVLTSGPGFVAGSSRRSGGVSRRIQSAQNLFRCCRLGFIPKW